MTEEQHRIIKDLWSEGIRLWYNDQDFLSAMQVWNEAIDSVDWSCDNTTTIVPTDNDRPLSGDASLLAPLLLFLAGCYLDAGDASAARLLCRRCISTEYYGHASNDGGGGDDDADFAHCLLSEYTATFQEDEEISEPWKVAYEIADWAMKERQTLSATTQTETTTELQKQKSTLLWKDPYQRPGFMYPHLASKAVYSRQERPDWCQALEKHYPTIRDEYERLMQGGGRANHDNNKDNNDNIMPRHWPRVGAGDHRDGAGQHDASVVQVGGDWREIVLFGSGARPDLAPNTCRILQQCAPEAVDLARQGAGEIIFSVLAPHTHISPHCASTNLRLTAHLGLQVPDGCHIQVAKETLHWEEGRIIVFDDSFQHEVHNESDSIRAVLLMRFWHPNLLPRDRSTALEYIMTAKETDRLRRCNPPLVPVISNGNHSGLKRHSQGMNQRMCRSCGRSGFETIRLIDPKGSLFGCICGQEAPV